MGPWSERTRLKTFGVSLRIDQRTPLRRPIRASGAALRIVSVPNDNRILTDAGNVHELANLLTGRGHAALCLGSERDATVLAARAAPITCALETGISR
jgi:hypothetical protein